MAHMVSWTPLGISIITLIDLKVRKLIIQQKTLFKGSPKIEEW